MSAVGIGLMVLPIAHFRAVFKLRYSNFRTLPNPEEYISTWIRKNDLSIDSEYLHRHWKNWWTNGHEGATRKLTIARKWERKVSRKISIIAHTVRCERKKLITTERRPRFDAKNIYEMLSEKFSCPNSPTETQFTSLGKIFLSKLNVATKIERSTIGPLS